MADGRVSDRRMIATRTPLRISLVGGGTDLPAFYEREQGAVLSTTINQYVWVTVKRHSELFFEPIRLNYKESEEVNHVHELRNDIARETMTFLEIEPPIYISTVGDVPASTGLGGSSAFCVGLLNALHTFRGERVSAGQLAQEACHIEMEVLGHPIGKQDQYAAAFGGLNVFRFHPSGSVTVEHQYLSNGQRAEIFESMLMFWTGHQRDANEVLVEQSRNVEAELDRMCKMRDQVDELQSLLKEGRLNPGVLGSLLDQGWRLKRELASQITNHRIDEWYERAVAAGAHGGKLCGAGNGGFLLFVVPRDRQGAVRQALAELVEMQVASEAHGSAVAAPFA
jgi:D-glycero-alpha-D-manno-heptose-7-phosphate kinase